MKYRNIQIGEIIPAASYRYRCAVVSGRNCFIARMGEVLMRLWSIHLMGRLRVGRG